MIVTNETLQSSPSGIDCIFVKIGDSGMKIYLDDGTRDLQFDLQTRFHKHGLAPNCWFSFDFKGPNGSMLYAYYSELAETRDTLGYDMCNDISCELYTEIKDQFGVEWSDDHAGNVGVLHGRKVIIDFGEMQYTERV